jgi:Flp pilus assembly protein TadB
MTALVPIIGGVTTAGALVLAATTLLPKTTDLAAELRAVEAQAPSSTAARAVADAVDPGSLARLGGFATPWLIHLGLPRPARLRDLALLGQPHRVHLGTQAGTAVLGVVTGSATWALLGAGGVSLPLGLAAAFALVLGALGFLLPDLLLARDAARQRAELRHATGAYLGLAAVMMAAGLGTESALAQAAGRGSGGGFARLRTALALATTHREPQFAALGRLGREADLTELVELAACASLAGSEGARVRATLATKADTLRARLINEQEARAVAASERTALPIGLITCGYLLMIGYPAVAKALEAL